MRALVPLILVPTLASADPRPMSAGAVPAPTTSAQVSIAKEDLLLDVGPRAADVRATLRLVNHGPNTRFFVGFPCEPDLDKEIAALSCKTRIDVRVGGKKVATTPQPGHWIWPLTLTEGQEVELTVAYRTPLRNDRYEVPFHGMGLLHYRLTTGAAWAGPIGELHVEVRMPTDALVYAAPAGFTRTHGTLTWSFKDYTPAEDLVVMPWAPLVGAYLKVLPAASRDELQARIDRGDLDGDAVAVLAGELRRQGDEAVRFAHFFLRDVAKPLGLTDPPDDAVRAVLAESARMMEDTARRGRHKL